MRGSTRGCSTTDAGFPALRSNRLALLLTLCAWAQTAAAQNLADRLDRMMDTPPFDRQFWGVTVTDADGKLVYGRNADRLFIPASNTKLVATVTALALLPPDGTVLTSVFGSGPVVAGVLQGDLVLYGRGDPTMSRRCYAVDTTKAGTCQADPLAALRTLAAAVAARGVTTVAGDLVGDGSWFEPSLIHPTWETGDLSWWYAAPVSGLAVNDNSVDVTVKPGASVGMQAEIVIYPDLDEIRIDNRTRTIPTGGRTTVDFVRLPGSWTILATGGVALGAASRTQYVSVPDPNRYAALLFRRVLAESGIVVLGDTRSTTDSLATFAARLFPPLAEVESRPYRDWIFPILNSSQNFFAEMLLKELGRQRGAGGSWEAGHAVTKRFLIDSIRADSTSFSLQDGSGLSATNFLTPRTITRLLVWMRGHREWPAFAAALPRSGQRGSLRTRFTGTPLEGGVLAKTGTISAVNALSGYVERVRGGPVVFSIVANHHLLGSRAMVAEIDSLVAAIARP